LSSRVAAVVGQTAVVVVEPVGLEPAQVFL
jgi:hypothetical protein